MILSKKNEIVRDRSNIYAFFLTVISFLSGIIGFNLSVVQNGELTHLYIYSLSISIFVQILSSSVLNYKKNAIISRSKYYYDIRNAILQFIFSNIIIVYAVVISISYLLNEEFNKLFLLIFLQLIFSYFQILSFHKSIYYQLKNLEFFFKIQFLGTTVRAIIILIMIYFLKFSFWGLIFGNIFSSFIIYLLYNLKFRDVWNNYKLGYKKIYFIPYIFKLDGILRSYRVYSEAWMVTTVVSLLNILKFMSPKELDLINFAVPYINSISVQFRQLFLKFSRESYLKVLNKTKFIFTYSLLIPLAFLYLFKEKFILLLLKHHYISLVNVFNQDFLNLISLQLFLLPLTLGYSYIDYANKGIYYKFLKFQISIFLMLLIVVTLIFLLFKSPHLIIIFPLVPLASIVLSKRLLVEKYL